MNRPAGDFWSRRKARVAAERHADTARAEAEALRRAEAAEDARRETLTEAELLEELGLPDPDTLDAGAEFKAYLAHRVPEAIRRRALRRLWRTNPVLACVDGLNDYDGDFTGGGKPATPIATAYRVGQGMLRHVEELQRQAAALEPADDAPAEVEVQAAPAAPVSTVPPAPRAGARASRVPQADGDVVQADGGAETAQAARDTAATPPDAQAPAAAPAPAEAVDAAPAPRHMVLSFDAAPGKDRA